MIDYPSSDEDQTPIAAKKKVQIIVDIPAHIDSFTGPAPLKISKTLVEKVSLFEMLPKPVASTNTPTLSLNTVKKPRVISEDSNEPFFTLPEKELLLESNEISKEPPENTNNSSNNLPDTSKPSLKRAREYDDKNFIQVSQFELIKRSSEQETIRASTTQKELAEAALKDMKPIRASRQLEGDNPLLSMAYDAASSLAQSDDDAHLRRVSMKMTRQKYGW